MKETNGGVEMVVIKQDLPLVTQNYPAHGSLLTRTYFSLLF
jgi:hypothetical protein